MRITEMLDDHVIAAINAQTAIVNESIARASKNPDNDLLGELAQRQGELLLYLLNTYFGGSLQPWKLS